MEFYRNAWVLFGRVLVLLGKECVHGKILDGKNIPGLPDPEGFEFLAKVVSLR